MTTGEQEHTRGDPRRGRPARYACCAPLAAYLLTRPLRPPGDTTRHPYTAAHPMAEDHPPRHHHQCKTTPPPPSGIQKPSAAAAYPEQQPPQRTHVTSSQRNRTPTYSHYPDGSRPPATTLPPTRNNPPRPATSRNVAAQPMHDAPPPGPWYVAPPRTPARPTPKLTPTRRADGSRKTTPNASCSTACWAT
jgi:hypothetical protein